MSNHVDEFKAQRAHLERLLDDHPQTCPKCLSSTDWDVVIALNAPTPKKTRLSKCYAGSVTTT